MNTLFLTIRSLCSLPVAVCIWLYATTVAPENGGQPVAPIRYDGDPNDIYLA